MPGLLVLAGGCDDSSSSFAGDRHPSVEGYPAYEIGDSALAVGDQVAELRWDDPEARFGSFAAVQRIPSGYVVADGLNQEIVFLDHELRVVGRVGRRGEGPGDEYQFPSALSTTDTSVIVLDRGLSRITELTFEGELLETVQLAAFASDDVAWHPALGILVTGSQFHDHYIARVTPQGVVPFGPIPGAFDPGPDPPLFRPQNLAAVTPDGAIHVVDGEYLAVVTFDEAGSGPSVALLPKAFRNPALTRRARTMEEGADRGVLSLQVVTQLTPLPQSRIAARVGGKDFHVLVLDPRAGRAVPVLKRPSDPLLNADALRHFHLFDGERAIFSSELGGLVALEVHRTALVEQQ